MIPNTNLHDVIHQKTRIFVGFAVESLVSPKIKCGCKNLAKWRRSIVWRWGYILAFPSARLFRQEPTRVKLNLVFSSQTKIFCVSQCGCIRSDNNCAKPNFKCNCFFKRKDTTGTDMWAVATKY